MPAGSRIGWSWTRGTTAGLIRVKVDDREYLIDATNPAPGLYSLVVHGKVYSASVWQRRGRHEVQIGHWSTSVEVAPSQQRPSAKPAAALGGRQEITAPMSGRVVQVLVQPGQTVQEGESLVIIEAMKMETEIRAIGPRASQRDSGVSWTRRSRRDSSCWSLSRDFCH